MRKLILASVLFALATPALADDPWTATPTQVSAQSGLVVNSVVWNCSTTSCWSVSDTSDADRMAECRGLARQFGQISAFSAHGQGLDTAHLTNCNQAARKPKS
jgi:hypothetical protein